MRYYFLGIGGIGMSALARYFHQRGDEVYGYDRTPSPLTAQLETEGINIHYTDNPTLIPANIDMIVYTPAVPTDTLEYQALAASGVRMVKRSQMLGELTRQQRCIAVAGSHGKTTTSSLIAHLLGDQCSAFLGGISKNLDSNLKVVPDSKYVVVEADEYDRSFLQLNPYIAIITATDPDHLDIYGTHQAMMDAYIQFANQTSDDGVLYLKQGIFRNTDGTPYTPSHHTEHHHTEHHHHDHDEADFDFIEHPYLTYTARGVDADCYAVNVRNYKGNLFFDLRTPSGVLYDLELQGAPLYNIENATVAIAVALQCGVSEEELRGRLKSFSGVARRFDFRIREKDLVYIDDYAHHPREIASTIEATRYLYPGKRVVGIFQPHLYTRTRDLAEGFASALATLDEVILMPIYPAREMPIAGVSSRMILDRIPGLSKYYCMPDQVLELVPALCPDVVLTMGAGDIDRLVPRLENVLKEQLL